MGRDDGITDDPSDRDVAELDDRLNRFNFERSGIVDGRSLSVMRRTAEGELYAGLHGFTWGGYCEIRLLWVADARRGEGIGSALLAAAESEARARGCDRIVLTTYSFQAPDFYARHGFRQVAAIEDCPRGFSHCTLAKLLPR